MERPKGFCENQQENLTKLLDQLEAGIDLTLDDSEHDALKNNGSEESTSSEDRSGQ